MTEDDFVALAAHLSEVRPIFDEFCAAHGFVDATYGRYPKIRIEREDGDLVRSFLLEMGLDAAGERFERFSRDLPYDFGANVSMIVSDSMGHRTRFNSWVTIFRDKPFHEIGAVLRSELDSHLVIVESVTAEYLRTYGTKLEIHR